MSKRPRPELACSSQPLPKWILSPYGSFSNIEHHVTSAPICEWRGVPDIEMLKDWCQVCYSVGTTGDTEPALLWLQARSFDANKTKFWLWETVIDVFAPDPDIIESFSLSGTVNESLLCQLLSLLPELPDDRLPEHELQYLWRPQNVLFRLWDKRLWNAAALYIERQPTTFCFADYDFEEFSWMNDFSSGDQLQHVFWFIHHEAPSSARQLMSYTAKQRRTLEREVSELSIPNDYTDHYFSQRIDASGDSNLVHLLWPATRYDEKQQVLLRYYAYRALLELGVDFELTVIGHWRKINDNCRFMRDTLVDDGFMCTRRHWTTLTACESLASLRVAIAYYFGLDPGKFTLPTCDALTVLHVIEELQHYIAHLSEHAQLLNRQTLKDMLQQMSVPFQRIWGEFGWELQGDMHPATRKGYAVVFRQLALVNNRLFTTKRFALPGSIQDRIMQMVGCYNNV